MVKQITILAGLIQMSLFAAGPCRGQVNRTLVLSPRVWATISAAERKQFHLFRQYDNFVEATAFQTPNGNCYVRITLEPSRGVFRDTVVEYTSRLLLMIADKINHFEALDARAYELGEEPTYIQTTDGQTVLESPAVLTNPSVLERRALAEARKWWDEGPAIGIITLGLSSGLSLRGKVTGIVDDSVFTFESEGKTLPIPVDSVSYLLRYSGTHMWEGAAIGTMVGIVAGVAIGAASYKRPQPKQIIDFGPGAATLGGASMGIVFGFSIGGAIGASIPRGHLITTEGAGHGAKLMVIRKVVSRE